MKVLILGHRGMLGHMVKRYFEKNKLNVETTDFKYPTEEFLNYVKNYNGDYIINCIGAIPQKTKYFTINLDLPIWLEKNSVCKIIHAGTDCEIDDDDYGISKREANKFIKEMGKKTKIIKSSIIGPELETKYSLMEWFLNSESTVYGYSKAMWNGNTTLEWAKNCYNILLDWENYGVETILEGECLSKYELLKKIKKVFSKNIDILESENVICDKCLHGTIKTKKIEDQLSELKQEYYNKNIYVNN